MHTARKGYTPQNLIFILGTAILTAVFLGGGLHIATQLQEGAQSEVSRVDGERIANGFSLLTGSGSATMRLNSTNEYTRIAIEGKELVLEADFLEGQRRLPLPRAFTYVESAVSGKAVCINKNGLRFSLSSPPCTSAAVSCDASTTIEGSTPEADIVTTGRCTYYEQDGSPTYGYVCTNGRYTRQRFYERYYTSCDAQPAAFIDINRLVCPDEASNDATYGCYVSFTYRCPVSAGTGSGELETPAGTFPFTPECTSNIEHRRIYKTFTATSGGEVSATVQVPGGGSDARSTTFTVS